MNKIERLAGIVFLLNQKGKIQAHELAEWLEVSERTIYRDIQALSELKVPIISETGLDGGYQLVDNYFLKPLILTEEECQSIYLGCQYISNQPSFPLAKASLRAMDKVSSLLTNENKEAINKISDKINFNQPDEIDINEEAKLKLIKKALESKKSIKIQYESLKYEMTTRKVDVDQLFYANNHWYIEGYCYLREEIRQFKLNRIASITLEHETFQQSPTTRENKKYDEEPIIIKIVVNNARGKRIKENKQLQPYIKNEENNWFYYHLPPSEFSDDYVIDLLNSFGSNATILQPLELKQRYVRTLRNILKKY